MRDLGWWMSMNLSPEKVFAADMRAACLRGEENRPPIVDYL